MLSDINPASINSCRRSQFIAVIKTVVIINLPYISKINKKYIEKKGKIILSDDDSGGNYNFAIRQKLPAGDYILSVKHCCFGEGPFSLTFEQDPANKTSPSN